MLHIVVRSQGQEQVLEHAGGPLEFGRGPASDIPRCVLTDPFVSRDHIRVELLPAGGLHVENLSHTSAIRLVAGEIGVGDEATVALPVALRVGNSDVEIALVEQPVDPERRATQAPVAFTPPPPLTEQLAPGIEALPEPADLALHPVALHELGAAPGPEVLAHWFQTLVSVQQAAATSVAFLEATARAVVELVGLDRGLVILRKDAGWEVAAQVPSLAGDRSPYSSTIMAEVLRLHRTVFRNFGPEALSSSLAGVDTVVAAPILSASHEVIGVVYGARSLRPDAPPPHISALEALVVQVLAAAAGAGLEREQQREKALRSQIQFEQFFSPELARELAADASILEGREREVTILFTDVRNFSRISDRLGPQRTFAMMQDVMDLQSIRIRETDGVVVDYVGDGLLAMWNAPAEQRDHPARACRAALHFLHDLPALSDRWQEEAGEPLRLGVGIHTGPALVGNTGSRVKFKYGPMGPAVNLASRLENATKTVGVGAIISRATRDRLPPAFGTRRLGGLRVQGFAKPVDVFQLFSGEATVEWRARRDTFEQALGHFEAGQWSEACQLLASLLSAGHDYDLPALQLLSRSVECLRSRPDPFDPAMTVQKQT